MKHLFVEPIPLPRNIVRNAMPSLHMSWALAIWWNLRRFRRPVSWAAPTFALLTVIGTLGTGEHYLIDLVVSFPFTMGCQAALSRHLPLSQRKNALIAAALLTSFWLVMLRFELPMFWISLAIPWTAIALTIAISLYLVWPLTRFQLFDSNEQSKTAITVTA
jgi:hypothetical protein